MDINYEDPSFRRACLLKIDKPDPPYKPALPEKEFVRFMFEAKARGLNPLLGHLWAQYRNGRWSFETTIDGLRFIAGNTGELAGGEPTEFSYVDKAFVSATVTIYRWQHGQRCPYTATAFYDEYVQRKKGKGGQPGEPVKMWVSMPRSQTEKCAESKALRKGFPEMGQIYTSDEMAQADNPTTASAPAPSGTSSPAGPSPVDAAQSTEQPNGKSGQQKDDSAERQQLVGAFKQLAVDLGIKEGDLSKGICLMAGIKSLHDADLHLINGKITTLQELGTEKARERIRKLLDKPTQDSQVSAVEALATLSLALGSGKPVFEHLKNKFGTRVVNAKTTPEILRLAELPLDKLREELAVKDDPAEPEGRDVGRSGLRDRSAPTTDGSDSFVEPEGPDDASVPY